MDPNPQAAVLFRHQLCSICHDMPMLIQHRFIGCSFGVSHPLAGFIQEPSSPILHQFTAGFSCLIHMTVNALLQPHRAV